MAVAEEQRLPTIEELTVPELEVTSAVLRASAHHLGKYCDEQCKEFMLCINETQDPRICIQEGKDVTKCAFQFFGTVKRQCYDDFTKYWKCIDHSSYDMSYKGCRATQKVFDKCVNETLGQERPYLGHFSKVRLHTTSRPRHTDLPHILPERLPEPPANPDDMPDPEMKKNKSFYY